MATTPQKKSMITTFVERQFRQHTKYVFTTAEGEDTRSRLLLSSRLVGEIVIAGTLNTESGEFTNLCIEPTPSLDEILSRDDSATLIPTGEISSQYNPFKRALLLARIALGSPVPPEDIDMNAWMPPNNGGDTTTSTLPE